MIIDAHVHVWDPRRAHYPWLTEELHPLDRTILLEDFPLSMVGNVVDGMVLVQAADCAEDTAIMREQAAIDHRVVGIVAWVPLDHPRDTAALLEDYGADPLIVGVRNLIHTREPEWLAGAAQNESLELLSDAGLTYDFVSGGFHALRELPGLSARHPKLRIVVDHLGKPPVGGTAADHARWRSVISDAAANPRVFAKLSGLAGPDTGHGTSLASIQPFVEDACEIFGVDRLMFGSDWPLVERAGGYATAHAAMARIFCEGRSSDHAAVFSQTAIRFYDLQERST